MPIAPLSEPIDLLLVDDEPDFLEPACRFFQRQGYRVSATSNAEQAISVQASQHFHVAVIDQNMPGMNGLELLKRLHESDEEIRIIMLTGGGSIASAVEAMKRGAVDYLSKPFTEESLFTVIKRNLPGPTVATLFTEKATEETVGTSNNECLYDLSMVRSVSGGDEAFIKKMVQLFIDTVPPGLVDLHEALAEQQWQKMGKIAHKLKSTIDSMGIVALRDDIRFIENSGKHEKDTDSVPPLINKVTDVIHDCIIQLKKDFSL